MKWSAVAVLRVSGRTLDVDAFVARRALSVDKVWRRGEQRRRGGVQEESGFNLTVAADASSAEALRKEVSTFLETSAPLVAELATLGAQSQLDVGVMVWAVAPASFEFPPEILATLARQGISLRATGYPCSDGENE